MGLELFGYIFICVAGVVASTVLLVGLRFGATDLGPAPAKVWVVALIVITVGWYWVYTIAPFEVVMK